MDILIAPSYVLTTNHAASSYGLPVLVNRTTNQAYGPGDIIDLPHGAGGMQPAAFFVHRFAGIAALTPGELSGVAAFLAQWPEGPQIRGDDAAKERALLEAMPPELRGNTFTKLAVAIAVAEGYSLEWVTDVVARRLEEDGKENMK